MSKRDKRWGAAIGDEVAARTRGLFPLPMGIEREDRCEQTVLQLGRGARFFWAQILVSSDCKTPWLDSHPGPRFQYHGGQNAFVT